MTKEKNIHNVEINISGEKWNSAIENAFNKVIKNIKVDGFRPGKVPREVYEKKYGKEGLYMEAAEQVLPIAYTQALQSIKEEPIIRPNVEIKKLDNDGVTYAFIITTKPVVKIKKYKNLNVKKEEIKVTNEDVENEIKIIQKQYAELVVKDGKIKDGDVAIIDFDGYKDEKPFDGGKATNYSLEIGSGSFIPGFEEALIGLKQNDEKDIKLKFPDDYPKEDLKGQEVVFKVKVNEVKEKKIPELNKEFFLDMGLSDIKNIDEFKKLVKEEISTKLEVEADNKYVDKLLEELEKQTEVELPHELVHEEIDRIMKQREEALKMQGITLEQFYQYTNTTEADIKSKLHEEAEKRVKIRFAIEEIFNLEKIDATDEEVESEIKLQSNKYNMSEEDLLKALGNKDMIKYDLMVRKVIEILKESKKK
ncbi:MAG TPA: trigger factor [Bacilli bacterium]|nr:trigger factor [Bacilli bacterium]